MTSVRHLHMTSPVKVRYLTGVNHELTLEAHRDDLGLLGTPDGSTANKRFDYPYWAADNGCFKEVFGGKWDEGKWLAWLERMTPKNCLWATLPDVVGDATATYWRSMKYIET